MRIENNRNGITGDDESTINKRNLDTVKRARSGWRKGRICRRGAQGDTERYGHNSNIYSRLVGDATSDLTLRMATGAWRARARSIIQRGVTAVWKTYEVK